MKRSKYNNIKAQSNGITFDSQFEHLVYEHLVSLFGCDCVTCQQPYPVIEATKYLPAVHYIVDFMIKSDSGLHPLLVEAKGYMTSDWLLKYKLLWEKHPVIAKNLIVIFPTRKHRQQNSIYARIPQMINLPDLPDYLRGIQWI